MKECAGHEDRANKGDMLLTVLPPWKPCDFM